MLLRRTIWKKWMINMKKISDFIWYEKYRQSEINDLVLPKSYVKAFNNFVKKKEIPHLLFFGPAGSGKTTISMILINKIASSKMILNASSEDRGIDTIKKKVKQFASSKRIDKFLNIIFFDEADGITPDAQKALKNIIETYHRNCRFIFTCNQIDKMIDPIISRCMQFHFNTVSLKVLRLHIETILKKENIEYDKKSIKKIIKLGYPDIRTIINDIELCSISGKLDSRMIHRVIDTKLITHHLKEGRLFALRNLWGSTSDFVWLYKFLFNEFIPKEVSNNDKKEVAITIAEYLYRDRTVADREINMAACCVDIMNILDVNIDFNEPF